MSPASPPPASDPAARRRFDALVEELSGAGVHRAQMMGRPTLVAGRTMLACLEGNSLGIRLGRDTPGYADALALPGAAVFAPGAGRRRFADWVAVPWDHADDWSRFCEVAMVTYGGRCHPAYARAGYPPKRRGSAG